MKRHWLVHFTGLAALALAAPAFAQSTTNMSGSSGTGLGSSSTTGTLGLSSGTGSSSTGSGAFGISGSSTSGNASGGLGSATSGTGTTSRTGTGTGTTAYNSNAGMYNSGRTGSGQTFFPGPTSSNPLASYYVSPMSLGNANTTTKAAAFGQPIYATVTSTTSGGSGARGQGAGATSTTTAAPAPPRFTITLDLGAPPRPIDRQVTATRLQVETQAMLSGSSMFSNSKSIQVGMEQGTLVLRGKVTSDRERRMAEGLTRLSPGVNSVRNELQVAP